MTPAEVLAALVEHRDQHYPTWSRERGLLNFAIALLRQVEHGSKQGVSEAAGGAGNGRIGSVNKCSEPAETDPEPRPHPAKEL